ncbi:hypothetical protein MHK_003356 [Candidatus Magnetomorum sp. HK-1]|nr:hypothetical protein MHK_003356 [Candidatus Magnetomorum sp. HK-1]
MPFKNYKHYLLRLGFIFLLCFMTGEPHLNGHEYRPFRMETLPEPLLPAGYVPPALDNPSIVTYMSAADIIRHINIHYESFYKKADNEVPNDPLKRLHQFMLTYDRISQLRYRRNVLSLPCQKPLHELIDYIMKSRWYSEYLILVSTNPIYDYSESTALRIIISAHTASHFFQIPFPTLFCLIFQESKFDFKIKSHTGALGLGQITRIAIKQINLLRKNEPLEDRRLNATANHIKSIYSDPVIDEILRSMGFYPMFPLLGSFPDQIKKYNPYSWKVVNQVSNELKQKGFSYGKNRNLVKRLIKRALKGEILRGKYAAVHPALLKITDVNYGKKFGTVLNIETNIIISAMLLKHYMNYKWIINKKKLYLNPSLSAIMAIAAYNQGPTVVREYLRYLVNRYPRSKIERATSRDRWMFLSKGGIKKAMKKKSIRVNELFEHIRKITLCSEGECH